MKKKKKTPSPEYQRNEVRLKLLTLLPSFQEDIKKIRDELGIPSGGFSTEDEFIEWYEGEFIKKTDEITLSKEYWDTVKNASLLERIDYDAYLQKKWEADDMIPLNKLNHRQLTLTEKYKLPANFYKGLSDTLFYYITRNILRPPSNNWAITPNPETRKGTMQWVSITTYGLLSRAEFKQAKNMLLSLQKHYFPKQIMISARIKKQFDRDFEIYQEFMSRKEKPIKRKSYASGSYLSYVSKNVSSKQLRRLEKEHSSNVEVHFSEKTSKEVAKKFKTNSTTVRKALERIHKLMGEMFPQQQPH